MAIFLIFLFQLSWGHPRILKTQPINDTSVGVPGYSPIFLWQGFVAKESLVKMKDGKVVYDTIVNRDAEGFRLIPSTATKTQLKHHLFFVGCSQTFGEGLNEGETFSSLVSEKLPHVRVVNMGLRGGGVTEQFHLWKHRALEKTYPERTGYMVYSIIPDHFERLRLTWRYLSWANRRRPIYKRVGDELEFVSSLEDRSSYNLAALLRGSVLEELWLRATHHFLPWELRDVEEDMAFNLSQLKAQYLRRFPQGHFVVTWQAISQPVSQHVSKFKFLRALEKYKIDVWINGPDYFEINRPEATLERRIPGDGHPNALANKEYTDFLLTKIKEKSLPQ